MYWAYKRNASSIVWVWMRSEAVQAQIPNITEMDSSAYLLYLVGTLGISVLSLLVHEYLV
jgi:hypothetical protein